MTVDELRHEIKMDAQACEELTVGDEPLSRAYKGTLDCTDALSVEQ